LVDAVLVVESATIRNQFSSSDDGDENYEYKYEGEYENSEIVAEENEMS
jgi:hypothetical protein